MDWWVTPSGTTVGLEVSGQRRVPNRDALAVDLDVASSGGMTREVQVHFQTPALIDVARQGRGEPAMQEEDRIELARIATLRAVDADPDFFEPSDPEPIAIGPGDDATLVKAPPISDAALRQYIVRRLYLAWREQSFDNLTEFDEVDAALTGMDAQAFLRNLQVLDEDGYIRLERVMGRGFGSFTARGTGMLVRAVEAHGAAPEDVEDKEEYLKLIQGIPELQSEFQAISLQRERYASARTAEEVESVFRSLVPSVRVW